MVRTIGALRRGLDARPRVQPFLAHLGGRA
jgi:hypothetical protein